MSRNTPSLFAGAAAAVLLSAATAYANTSMQDFVGKASIANNFEIESSQLALDKAQNMDVKSFAQHMIDDHTEAAEKLQDVLESSESDLKPEDEMDSKHMQMMDKLQAASDNNFDKQYVDMQTDAHQKAVDLFSDYSKNGKDPALKAFASEMLPTLKDHLKQVKAIKLSK